MSLQKIIFKNYFLLKTSNGAKFLIQRFQKNLFNRDEFNNLVANMIII